MKNYSFDAVIFDLDGVITKTALVHAKAWKQAFDEYLKFRQERDKEPFCEFTYENDYLTYVDGKPRYKGVKSFLESRGVNIPFGDPGDSSDKETVCGIGNRKNVKFLEIISSEGIEVYRSTIQLIKDLKQAGVRTGVASSSKNCKTILQSVNIEDLFETRVDGVVSAELGLKGKPEGDIFSTAALNVAARPGNSVVVEDANSGVQAGRNAGFGLVIGVARESNEQELFDNGADVVVKDLAEITPQWIEQWFKRKPRPLFENWDEVSRAGERKGPLVNLHYSRSAKEVFSSEKVVFFLDYDGTLTPIVSRPDLAVLSDQMRSVVKQLSQQYTTAIVSGRMREDVEKLVGIKGLFYAGSHGFDILGPQVSMVEPHAEEVIPVVTEVISQLKDNLQDIEGLLVEEKKFSVAVHYRLVDEDKFLDRIQAFVEKTVKANPCLRMMQGKKVFEILPAIDWDKGKAVRWIMQAFGFDWSKVSVVYIGDDTTDEDAFRVVRSRGTAILVADKPKNSCADFQLVSPEEVKALFERILKGKQ